MTGKRVLPRGAYAVTDYAHLSEAAVLAVTEEILRAGIVLLQYRDKAAGDAARRRRALALRRLCRRYRCPLLINDDPRLAQEVQADGAHLGKDDGDCEQARAVLGSDAIIGVSCYDSLARARAAAAAGADYLAFGAFFPSASKEDAAAAHPAIIKQAKENLGLPVAAIGGVAPDNCAPLAAQGADLLAAVRGIYHAASPGAAVRAFNRILGAVPHAPVEEVRHD